MGKRAQINVQFNWIFILIAGALILGFFSMMAVRQKSASTITISAKVKENLAAIFEGARTSAGTSTIVKTGVMDLDFHCERGYSTFEVGGLSTQIPADVIFAPKHLEGRDMITWSLSWDLPFKIMNFLFISNARTRYVIIGDPTDDLFQMINETFPKEFMVDYVSGFDLMMDPNLIENLNDDSTRLIYVNEFPDPNYLRDLHMYEFKDNLISALHIDGTIDSGTLSFYEWNRLPALFADPVNSKVSTYAGLATLFGAIFSETREFYQCNMKKALRRFNFVNDIYWIRTMNMEEKYRQEVNAQCVSYFSAALINFEEMNITSSCVFRDDCEFLPNAPQPVFTDLNTYALSIADMNEKTKIGSCDLIY